MSLTASSMPLMRSWLTTFSPCSFCGTSSGLGLMQRTKWASHCSSVDISAASDLTNFAPTDAKPPLLGALPLTGSGVQMATTSSVLEASSASSTSGSSESLFFSRNSSEWYTTSPAKCLTTKNSSFERFSVLEILGAPKTFDFGSFPCVWCSEAQKALPVGLGPLHAESSCT